MTRCCYCYDVANVAASCLLRGAVSVAAKRHVEVIAVVTDDATASGEESAVANLEKKSRRV